MTERQYLKRSSTTWTKLSGRSSSQRPDLIPDLAESTTITCLAPGRCSAASQPDSALAADSSLPVPTVGAPRRLSSGPALKWLPFSVYFRTSPAEAAPPGH